MTTTFKWLAGEGATGGLTTELDALGSGNTALTAAIDNLTDLYQYIDLELYLASFTPGATPYVSLWFLASVDGTNYEDGTAGTPGVVPDRQADVNLPLKASTASAYRKTAVNIPIPPLKFKILVQNNSGQAFAANSNTLKYNRHNEQVA